MPFKSEKQRRYLWLKHPDIAKRWAKEYPGQKNLPLYAHDKDDKDDTAAKSEEKQSQVEWYQGFAGKKLTSLLSTCFSHTPGFSMKQANSIQRYIDIPHSDEPTYAGEEHAEVADSGKPVQEGGVNESAAEKIEKSPLLQKLSVVLSRPLLQFLEDEKATQQARQAARIPQNANLKQYPVATPTIPPPIGMAQAPAQSTPQAQPPQPAQPAQSRSVGNGAGPTANPINAFGALSSSGQINGNAAFGVKNSPDSLKTAGLLLRDLKEPSPVVMPVGKDDKPFQLAEQYREPRLLARPFYHNNNRALVEAMAQMAMIDPTLLDRGVNSNKPFTPRDAMNFGLNLKFLYPDRFRLPPEGERALAGNPAVADSRRGALEFIQKTSAHHSDYLGKITNMDFPMHPDPEDLDLDDEERMKTASANTPCSCGCGDTVKTCKCSSSCSCRKAGGSCYKAEKQASKPGLWANIHAKKKRGEKPAKPGDKDYPDTKSWNKTVKSSGLFDFLTRKPGDDWAPPSPPNYAQFDAKGDYDGFDKADTAYLNQMKKYLKSRGYSDIKEQIYEPGGTPWSMRGPDNQYYELQLDADDGPVAKPVPLQKLYGVHKPEEYYRQGPGLAAAPNWEQLNAQSMANSKLRTEADVKKYIQKWVKKHNDPSFIDDSWEALEEDLPLRWGPDAFHPDSFGDELHTDIGDRLRDPKQFDGAMKDLLAKLNLKPTQKAASSPAWQRSEGKNPEGGLNAKGRASYKAQTGGTLKAPVTESNPTGERDKRQNSFCSRMCGMKRVNTGADTAKDPDSRINKSLRKWNCKCGSAFEFGKMAAESEPANQPKPKKKPKPAVEHPYMLHGGVLAGLLLSKALRVGYRAHADYNDYQSDQQYDQNLYHHSDLPDMNNDIKYAAFEFGQKMASMAPVYGALAGAGLGLLNNAVNTGDVQAVGNYAIGNGNPVSLDPNAFPYHSLDHIGRNMAEGAIMGGAGGVGYDALKLMFGGKPKQPEKEEEKTSANRRLAEIPAGSGPDQIEDAVMRFNQLRALVRPDTETLKGRGLSRGGFQHELRRIATNSQGKDKYNLSQMAPNPGLRAAIAGAAGLAGTGALAYMNGAEGLGAGLAGTGLAAGGAYLHGLHQRNNFRNTSKLLRDYGLLKPELLRQAYPLLADNYRAG